MRIRFLGLWFYVNSPLSKRSLDTFENKVIYLRFGYFVKENRIANVLSIRVAGLSFLLKKSPVCKNAVTGISN
ncbi:MAG: hypothetical protein QG610_2027 [Euryarchaeota archaeon]|nr:hypothetical protein [Euryarchaeota archaeon]